MLKSRSQAVAAMAFCAALAFLSVPSQAGFFDFLKSDSEKQKDQALSPDLGKSDDQQVAGAYNAGLDQMSKGNYKTAAKKFGDVERLYPYSKWATKAILMQAFAFYQANQYADSIDACQRFITLHPGHENIDYAYYMVALSQYEQINDITRDQGPTKAALDSLEEVQRRFPGSRYAADAGQKALLARDHLAGKEMEVGRYYFKHGDWLAGINRFKNVITSYQQTSQAPEALYRLSEGYMALGIRSEAQTAAAVLGANFPRSTWYKDAYQLVSTNGQAPEVSTGSWIAKAFGL